MGVGSCHHRIHLRVLQTDRNAAGGKELLQLRNRVLGVVEDAGGQRGVGLAAREDVEEVLKGPGAAGRDHRDRYRRRDRGGQLAVESLAGAVAVDRRQQDLAGAARLRLARPLDRFPIGGGAAASRVDGEAALAPAWRRSRRRPPGCRSGAASRVISAGSASAALFTLTLSAPASIAASASSSDRMPPPTASGMNSSRETRANRVAPAPAALRASR